MTEDTTPAADDDDDAAAPDARPPADDPPAEAAGPAGDPPEGGGDGPKEPPGPASGESPVEGGGEPSRPLSEKEVAKAAAWKSQADAAMDEPLFPKRGPRCPLCGDRLDGREVKACGRCGVDPRTPEAGRLIVPRGSWWGELLRGASYLPRGFFRIARSPSLWKFAIVPFVLNLIAIGLALVAAFYLSEWLAEQTGPDKLEDWTGWFWGAMSYVVWFLGMVSRVAVWIILPILVTVLIVAFPFNLLYKLVFMPFMELLTEATERKIVKIKDDATLDFGKFYANLVVAIVDAILLTLLQGLFYVLLLPVNVIPFLGSVLWMVIPPAVFAGMDYSDLMLVRRGYPTREKIRLWRTHQWRFLGYGMSFFFLLAVPIVNAFVVPAAAAGGALLYLELERK